jgi:cytochrome c551/c552
MNYQSRIAKTSIFSILLLLVISFQNLKAQDGKALFQANCASCHAVNKDLTGPALAGVEERVPDKKLLHAWIHNNQKVLASGNKYFNDLYVKYNKTPMQVFESLSDADIDAILKYVSTPQPGPAAGAVAATETEEKGSDNSLLFGILSLILAVITLILLQVNSNLRKLSDDKEGVPAFEPVPFYRNKTYITLFTLVLFVVGGYYTIQGAIGLGRNKNYQPEQPIFYSHKVHAGTNQINCLYCHGGAQLGKQANIPSLNICMNCHMAINEYSDKSEKLYREDGTEVNGTAEIKKLYSYTGWDPAQKKYANEPKPIEWVRIHNLPDHVYFNHSQHVVAGKQACQTCHGEIQKENEVYQFADLSMGWCINCHRETKVQFTDNKFYSIYEKFHDQMKDSIKNKDGEMIANPHKLDSITVETIGGTECQKCHY